MPNKSIQMTIGGINLTLTRKRVKRINLRVRSDGSVAVSASPTCSMARIEAFINEKYDWIISAKIDMHARTPKTPTTITPAQARAIFMPIFTEVHALFADAIGPELPILKVSQLKASWGICSPSKKRITLNIDLAAKDPSLIQYVVVHEYAHFIECNHSKAFWAVVERYIPDWKARRALLNGR